MTRIRGLKFTDTRAIEQAVADLQKQGIKCSLVRNQKPRVHGMDASPTCDYVVKLNGAYDLGLEKQKDGSFTPVFDSYMHHVGKEIGATCPMPNTAEGRLQHEIGKFAQSYALNAAKNKAMSEGMMVESESIDAEGNINLVLTGM